MTRDELKMVAQEELNETSKTRRGALKEIREWIRNQEDTDKYRCLENVSDDFLLRFLRMQKLNVNKAIAVMENYLGFRTNSSEWFDDLDISNSDLNDLISSGYIFVLPGRDASGRRVIFSQARSLDGSRYTSADVMRAHLITYEALLAGEECQINGVSYIFDEEGVNLSHVGMWTPADVTRAFKCSEKAIPLRHREVNFVNMPWSMYLIYQFAKNLLSHKLRSRLHTHSNFEKVREFFPVEMLPSEYGGSVPMADMIEDWKKELEQKRDQILSLDSMKFYLNQNSNSSRACGDEYDGDAATSSETLKSSACQLLAVEE